MLESQQSERATFRTRHQNLCPAKSDFWGAETIAAGFDAKSMYFFYLKILTYFKYSDEVLPI